MRKLSIKTLISLLILPAFMFAGNEQRSGQAGGAQLMLSPWYKTNSLANANNASVRGIEAVCSNVAGSAFVKGTDIQISVNDYLRTTDTRIMALGISQRVGGGALSMSVMSYSFGEIKRTTTDNPDGIGYFKPNMNNFTIAYAKSFSDAVSGGIAVKVISEGTENISGNGVCIDGGIQYVASLGKGKKNKDNFKFGIALQNIGTPYYFKGDAAMARTNVTQGSDVVMTLQHRSAALEFPALLRIGFAYDLKLGNIRVDSIRKVDRVDHLVSLHCNFISNSFKKDQYQFGLEYTAGFLPMGTFSLRAGYFLEPKSRGLEYTNSSVYSGPSFGASVGLPYGKTSKVEIGYSYLTTKYFGGVSILGAHLVF